MINFQNIEKEKKKMIPYKTQNVNPKNRKTGDCVVRALTVATGNDYNDVLKDLCELQIKTGYSIDSNQTIERYLDSQGFQKHKQPRKPNGKKYLVGEIDQLIKPHEPAVVSLAGHLTAVVDGHIIDIWDCRRKTIGNYYTLK